MVSWLPLSHTKMICLKLGNNDLYIEIINLSLLSHSPTAVLYTILQFQVVGEIVDNIVLLLKYSETLIGLITNIYQGNTLWYINYHEAMAL